ncbi:MAG: Holliday junction branch migration protein RuvA [Lachnospiraceae bacterium]|nr:Holliday junction branch migration protein RuvA [Lachnospiraceae bacterium]
MIASVRGEVSSLMSDSVLLENHGIGYQIYVPTSFLSSITPGDEIKLYTYLSVKEDALQLFGFPSLDALSVFRLLIGVNGIGPKGALAILSSLSPDDLRVAVSAGDTKLISRTPGIGIKTAQRLVLELKDKLKIEDIFSDDGAQFDKNSGLISGNASATLPSDGHSARTAREEAVQALMALGYSSSEAARAVRGVNLTDNLTVEEVLKQALKNLY